MLVCFVQLSCYCFYSSLISLSSRHILWSEAGKLPTQAPLVLFLLQELYEAHWVLHIRFNMGRKLLYFFLPCQNLSVLSEDHRKQSAFIMESWGTSTVGSINCQSLYNTASNSPTSECQRGEAEFQVLLSALTLTLNPRRLYVGLITKCHHLKSEDQVFSLC